MHFIPLGHTWRREFNLDETNSSGNLDYSAVQCDYSARLAEWREQVRYDSTFIKQRR